MRSVGHERAPSGGRPPLGGRVGGFAPIRDYAAIGDGRTVALVARDGSIDWLTTPTIDSPSVFGALLDPASGGSFALAPDRPSTVSRTYLPGTCVLATTFATAQGTVRVTDAMTASLRGLPPQREVVRTIDGLSGIVAMRWHARPGFGYGKVPMRVGRRGGVPIVEAGGDALAVSSFGAGDAEVSNQTISGRFQIAAGERAILSLSLSHQEPLVLPSGREVGDRLQETIRAWETWSGGLSYQGPWEDAVRRSALTLKLLSFAPSGAIAAAPTTSLPETIGGERNWDYRYCWIRDSAFTLDAMLRLGQAPEAEAFFWWMMQASQLTHPRLQVLYRLDGGAQAEEQSLDLEGYRGSRPVRIGNAAAGQLQLDIYGDLFETAWVYAEEGNRIDADIGRRLAEAANHVASIWRLPDAGIWEVRGPPRHFTHSKVMCWVALDRAVRLAASGRLPDRHVDVWRRARTELEDFIWAHCWSDRRRSLVRAAGEDDLDAALLLTTHFGFPDRYGDRLVPTVEAIRRELGPGATLYRYSGEDGLEGHEGAFFACSFWLAEALARLGRYDEAAGLMDELTGMANDVGLYSEEIDPDGGEFLGNFPQGLTHLALIQSAVAISRA